MSLRGIPSYDGLYADLPGHVRRRVYRNPSLLITGGTALAFSVAG